MLVFYFEMARNRNAICINCIIELLQKMHRLIKLVCAIFTHCKFLKKEKTRQRCYATGVYFLLFSSFFKVVGANVVATILFLT